MNVAIDPGFGGFKTAIVNGDVKTSLIPSVVGAGALKNSGLSTGLGRGRKLPNKPYQIVFNNQTYLVGQNVHLHTRPIQRLDFNRLANGPELRALIYASLWQTFGAGDHTINLLIGLPVEVQQDRQTSNSIRARLRGWLVGDHHFVIDGEAVSVTVHRVRTMAQPLGAFFNWGMNTNAEWVKTDDPRGKFAVCDIGFNTLDLFVIQNAQVNERFSNGDKLGMRRACRLVKDTVRAQYGVKLSFPESDQLLRDKKPLLHYSGGVVDLSPVIAQAVGDSFGAIAEFLEDTWENDQQFRRIILAGGGTDILREKLTALLPHAIIPGNAQLTNAVGLAKFAQRKQVFG